MRKKEIKLKPKKDKKDSSFTKLFENKNRRYLFMFLFMLPFIIGICIFGYIGYKEVVNLINLAKGTTEVKKENIINGTDYILRDNPTDLQKEYFKELKSAIEDGVIEEEGQEIVVDDLMIAELVAKNYIADFYTWTNKQGSFDVGGLTYVFDGEYDNGDHFKDNVYLAAKDGFYKYINNYINEYGQDNVLEVIDIEIKNSERTKEKYFINEHVAYKQVDPDDEDSEWYDYREDHEFDTYLIKCNWTYDTEKGLNPNQFANSINLLIINKNGKYMVIEASEGDIKVRTRENVNGSQEETEQNKEGTNSQES